MSALPVVLQPLDKPWCGQACVAMLLGIDLAAAIKLVGKRSGTHAHDLSHALRANGWDCPDDLVRLKTGAMLPPRCLVRVRLQGKRYASHWMIRWDGSLYDPGLGRDHPWHDIAAGVKYRVTSYLPLDSAGRGSAGR